MINSTKKKFIQQNIKSTDPKTTYQSQSPHTGIHKEGGGAGGGRQRNCGMLSAGLPENHRARGVGEVEGVGWLSVPWGAEGVRKKKNGGEGSST